MEPIKYDELYKYFGEKGVDVLNNINAQFGSGVMTELQDSFLTVPGLRNNDKFFASLQQNEKTGNYTIKISGADLDGKWGAVMRMNVAKSIEDPDAWEIMNTGKNRRWVISERSDAKYPTLLPEETQDEQFPIWKKLVTANNRARALKDKDIKQEASLFAAKEKVPKKEIEQKVDTAASKVNDPAEPDLDTKVYNTREEFKRLIKELEADGKCDIRDTDKLKEVYESLYGVYQNTEQDQQEINEMLDQVAKEYNKPVEITPDDATDSKNKLIINRDGSLTIIQDKDKMDTEKGMGFVPIHLFKWGDKDKDVKRLQEYLCMEGYLEEDDFSGKFDSKTEKATKKFQEAHDMPVTGELYGYQLNDAIANKTLSPIIHAAVVNDNEIQSAIEDIAEANNEGADIVKTSAAETMQDINTHVKSMKEWSAEMIDRNVFARELDQIEKDVKQVHIISLANQRSNIKHMEQKLEMFTDKQQKWQEAGMRFVDAKFPGHSLLAKFCAKKAGRLEQASFRLGNAIESQRGKLAENERKAFGEVGRHLDSAKALLQKYTDKGYKPNDRLIDMVGNLEFAKANLDKKVNGGKSTPSAKSTPHDDR